MKKDRMKITVPDGKDYDIVFRNDFDDLVSEIKAVFSDAESRKFAIITDSNVKEHHGDAVEKCLKDAGLSVYTYAFKEGESNKNLETVQDIYEFLILNRFNRRDVLIALGGGVTGDMTGFVAASYLRGIDFIQIPTSLLAQVDSSIGGKTGVDFKGYKNMVGAFKMPRLVYMNLSVLSTLSKRQFYAGMAEVLKDALLADEKFYVYILDKLYEIHDLDPEVIQNVIYKCCDIKRNIVENDPYEKGERALLNLGHTLGHAIEKYKNFEMLHGECVALGTICAAFISKERKLISDDEYYEIRDMMVPFFLPITVDDIDVDEVIKLTKNDKKAINGGVKFVLLKKAGEAFIDETVTDDEMRAALNEIHFTEDDMKE